MISALRFATLALALTAPWFLPAYAITLIDYIGVYALVAIGLTLLTGVAGIVSFGQAAFVGIAAYASAWLTTAHGLSAWAGLGFALALVLSAATLIGAATLRLNGHLLSLSTLVWGLAIYTLFANVEGMGRFTGITDIPPIWVGQMSLAGDERLYYLILVAVIGALLLTSRLLASRTGRAIRSLRGGGLLVESVGANLYRVRLVAFVWAAGLAGLSGWLQAHLGRVVSPTLFDAGHGVEYLMMAMIGGAASPVGGLIGAALVALSKNAIQDYLPRFTQGAVGPLEIVLFSVLFILLLQRAREGLTPLLANLVAWALPARNGPMAFASPAETPRDGRYLKTRSKRSQPATLNRGPLLRFLRVSRRFKGLQAVDDLSFDVGLGEIVGLIGPNGAGKSTAMSLLTGVLAPDVGKILFNGARIDGRRPFRLARRGIARTFQRVKLRPQMSVLDNVLIGAYVRLRFGALGATLDLNRGEEAEARLEARHWLARVGLAERADHRAENLTLGQQRLVEVARALMADPILLALDEPATGLRLPEKQALAALLQSLRNEGLTILIVEQDMNFVMNFVDRLVVMNFGTKLCEGAPHEVRADPKVRETYFGGGA